MKINIQYNRFLDPIFVAYIRSREGYKRWKQPTIVEVKRNIRMYKKEWDKYGDKILTGIQKVTGLKFKRHEIDVYVVSGNPRSFSRPIVMKSTYTKVDFLNVLTHELIHCLYSDNCKTLGDAASINHDNPVVKNHVILHSILKHVYLNVLKEPRRLKADIKFCSGSKYGYDIAWDLVQKGDYREIIKEFKKKVRLNKKLSLSNKKE